MYNEIKIVESDSPRPYLELHVTSAMVINIAQTWIHFHGCIYVIYDRIIRIKNEDRTQFSCIFPIN